MAASEKPLQVTHNLQVSDGERGEMTLLRDQIVIQVRFQLAKKKDSEHLFSLFPHHLYISVYDERQIYQKKLTQFSTDV